MGRGKRFYDEELPVDVVVGPLGLMSWVLQMMKLMKKRDPTEIPKPNWTN